MRVSRVPRAPAELEIDSLGLSGLRETGLHHASSFGAESLVVVLLFVDAGFGRIGVEVEWEPGDGEFVGGGGIWMGGAVEIDAPFEALFADVAPLMGAV